jgi:hypothetical protein
MNLHDFRRLIMRHRVVIRGLCVIFAISMGSLYVAYKVDIFPNEGAVAVHEATIELDEALLVAAITLLALFIFGAAQYLAQKREMRGRIAAWLPNPRAPESSMPWLDWGKGGYSVSSRRLRCTCVPENSLR